MFLFKRFSVPANHKGYLFRKNILFQTLEPGIYSFFDPGFYLKLYSVPEYSKIITVSNQEVLTKDNVAFRFSYFVKYRISDGKKFLSSFSMERGIPVMVGEAEYALQKVTQIKLRNLISSLSSEELNEKRNEITDLISDDMIAESSEYGLALEEVALRDITFPKTIQDVFAKLLESKIRGKADLENARTNVATARALKNASEIMKGDENIKFIQVMETITKIAATGKHNFYFGNFSDVLGNQDKNPRKDK